MVAHRPSPSFLEGSGSIAVDGESHDFQRGDFVRVGPGATRKLHPGSEGVAVLALGGTPGKVFTSSL